jgi:hypothetical protein
LQLKSSVFRRSAFGDQAESSFQTAACATVYSVGWHKFNQQMAALLVMATWQDRAFIRAPTLSGNVNHRPAAGRHALDGMLGRPLGAGRRVFIIACASNAAERVGPREG